MFQATCGRLCSLLSNPVKTASIESVRYYAVPKRKLIRKPFFVYTSEMKRKVAGNPYPRLKLILLEDVEKIGMKWDVVQVKRRVGRNDLIPNRKAVYASDENLLKYGIELKSDDQIGSKVPQNVVRHLKNAVVTIPVPSNNGSNPWMITRHDVAHHFSKRHYMHVPVHCMNIKDCGENVIYSAGEYTLEVTINNFLTVPVRLVISVAETSSDLLSDTEMK